MDPRSSDSDEADSADGDSAGDDDEGGWERRGAPRRLVRIVEGFTVAAVTDQSSGGQASSSDSGRPEWRRALSRWLRLKGRWSSCSGLGAP